MNLLDVDKLSVRYGLLTIVDEVSFELDEGQWLMVVGPNGAGKSTIINAIAQGVPYSGTVRCEGHNVHGIKPKQLAKKIAVLAQGHQVGYSFTVGEVVRLGRYAYTPGIFSDKHTEDEAMIEKALSMTGLLPLINQSVLTLSGGELQRTFLAQIFAQNPQILMLDEPTNHLDLVFQEQTFELIQSWLQEPGRAVVSVVHDLSLAKAYGTHALLLDKGQTVAQGVVKDVLSPSYLNNAYGMDVYGWMQKMLRQWNDEKVLHNGF